jgi:[ribosomal protein S18]-alanine N-acetyltransferase
VTLKFRRMTLDDISAVHAIDLLSFSLPWPQRSFVFEVSSNPASRGWVADADGQVVAMLVLWLIIDEAHIATIATHPDHRRKGIGERLMVEALTSACEEGARRAFLEVRAGNLGAQALYKKYGFIVDGVRPRYYKDNNEDAILMSLDGLEHLHARAEVPEVTEAPGGSLDLQDGSVHDC